MHRLILTLAFTLAALLPLESVAQQEPVLLDTIYVETDQQEERVQTTTVIGRERLDEIHAASLNDYLFSAVPGVTTARRSNFGFSGPGAGVSIRGLTGTRIMVVVDGVPSQVNSHGHPRMDQYSPDMLDRIELLRGPSGVEHGASAVGGAIEISTRRPPEGVSGRIQGMAGELASRQLLGDAAYGWGTGSILVSAMDQRTDAQIIGEAFRLRNVNLKVEQEVLSGWKLGGRFNQTKEPANDLFGQDPAEVFFRYTEDLKTYVVTLGRESAQANSLIAFSFNDLGTGSFRESRNGGITNQSDRVEQEIAVYLKQGFTGSWGTLTVGADWVEYNDERLTVSPRASDSHVSGFVSGQHSLTDQVRLEGGVRSTYSSHFGHSLSPEAGANFRVAEATTLRARGGKSFRVPRVTDLQGVPENRTLDPEDFFHAEAGINQLVGNRVLLDLAVWKMWGRNLIQSTGTGANILRQNTGTFDHDGLEATARFALTHHITLRGAATVMRLDQSSAPNAPRRLFDLGTDVHVGPVDVTLLARHASKNTNSALDDYLVADARISYDFRDRAALFLDIVNLTDERYATLTGSEGPIEQVPRVFMAGVRWTFGGR
jgi:vitamin B12 transporter